MATIPRGSVEYVHVPVTVTAGIQPITPVVHVAVIPPRTEPEASDFTDADWVDGQVRFLAAGLTPGAHEVWVRITDAPEVVIRHAGPLTVT